MLPNHDKKTIIMKVVLFAFWILMGLSVTTTTLSCKNKKETTNTEQNKDANDVVISSDAQLRTSVNDVADDYPDVKATINDGVVNLTGSISQADLQNLIMRIQELKPKKVENNLVIK